MTSPPTPPRAPAVARLVTRLARARARAGRGPRDDAWRTLARVELRSDESRFGLAAFGLALPASSSGSAAGGSAGAADGAAGLATGLADFLRTRPEAQWLLDTRRSHTIRRPARAVDVVTAHFRADGSLLDLLPTLDPTEPVPVSDEDRRHVDEAVVAAYNLVRGRPEYERPAALREELEEAGLPGGLAADYIERLLGATWLVVEGLASADAPERWRLPDFARTPQPGLGLLNARARLLPDGALDLWLDVQHIAADGAPMQELLADLRQAWGSAAPARWPAPAARSAAPAVRCSVGAVAAPVEAALDFADCGPLLALRAELNEAEGAAVGGPLPVAALLAWCLSAHPRFRADAFAVPVDLPATNGLPRSVTLAVARPASYRQVDDVPTGFVAYAQAFRAELALAQARDSELYHLFHLLAMVPPAYHQRNADRNHARKQAVAGSVGISVLKDAEIFVAPISDTYRCYIALADLRHPAAGGGKSGAVSMKYRERADWDALCAVLAEPRRFL